MIPGERRWPNKFGRLLLPRGAYGRDILGKWWCAAPDGTPRRPLNGEAIVEHGDDTVTFLGEVRWGTKAAFMLERGTWRKLGDVDA